MTSITCITVLQSVVSCAKSYCLLNISFLCLHSNEPVPQMLCYVLPGLSVCPTTVLLVSQSVSVKFFSFLCYPLVAILKQNYTFVMMTHYNTVQGVNTGNQTAYCVEGHV